MEHLRSAFLFYRRDNKERDKKEKRQNTGFSGFFIFFLMQKKISGTLLAYIETDKTKYNYFLCEGSK